MRRILLFIALGLLGFLPSVAHAAAPLDNGAPFPPQITSYDDAGESNLWTVLVNRAHTEPFNLIATGIFLLAIVHTFLAPKILKLSHQVQHRHEERFPKGHPSILAAVLHFLGEVEAVFGLWVIPLAVAISLVKGPEVMRTYIDQTVTYTEPLFVVVIMAIAASRPVVQAAARVMGLMAGQSPARWWFVLLTIGPLLGS